MQVQSQLVRLYPMTVQYQLVRLYPMAVQSQLIRLQCNTNWCDCIRWQVQSRLVRLYPMAVDAMGSWCDSMEYKAIVQCNCQLMVQLCNWCDCCCGIFKSREGPPELAQVSLLVTRLAKADVWGGRVTGCTVDAGALLCPPRAALQPPRRETRAATRHGLDQ